MESVYEVVPHLAWTPAREDPLPESPAGAFRRIDACREGRQRLVLGGHGGLVVVAAYLLAHLAPTVPAREVLDLLETKLPPLSPLSPRVRQEAVAYWRSSDS